MNQAKQKRTLKLRRQGRIRARLSGSATIPRLAVSRSNRRIFVQVIDDAAGKTLLSNQIAPLTKGSLTGNKTAQAGVVGKTLAEKLITAGIKQIVFDRRGNKYHGRVKAVADSLRDAGLKF